MCVPTAGQIDLPRVVPIEQIGAAQLASVGGKAARAAFTA